MIADQVKSLAHQMRLLGIHMSAERRAAQAVADGLHPIEFLRLLLEDELLARKDRTAKKLTTKADFRRDASLEDYDMTFDRGFSKAKLKELMTLNFMHTCENLILLGKTGEGKTQLAIALGRRLCTENHPTLFLSVNMFFEEIKSQRACGKYLSYLRSLKKAKVVVLDDFGSRSYSHDEAVVLMDLLEERYQKGSVVITSQVDPKGWGKLFEDPVVAEAVVNRLEYPSQKITFKGGSYRERLQLQKQQKLDVKKEKD